MTVAVVVLAGGRASRLAGADKAMLELAGVPLLHRVLAAAPADRVVVVGPRRPVPLDVTWTREDPPGGGPVAGLAAGLAELADLGDDYVTVLAADLAGLTGDTVTRLRAAARDHEGAVLVDGDRIQWLTGVWRLDALRAALPADPVGASVRSMLGTLAARHVRALPGEAADIDTPADLHRLG